MKAVLDSSAAVQTVLPEPELIGKSIHEVIARVRAELDGHLGDF